MTITDALLALCRDYNNEILPQRTIYEYVSNCCHVDPRSVRMAPYCYNQVVVFDANKPKLLEFIPDTNSYRLVGSGIHYTGDVFVYVKNLKEYVNVGYSVEGAITLYPEVLDQYDL